MENLHSPDTLCFTGHRPNKFSFGYDENHVDCIALKEALKKEIVKSIDSGYLHFISGMAIGVDIWTAEIVLSLKELYPLITLEAALPCKGQERRWPKPSQDRYNEILAKTDKQTLVSDTFYTPYCMIKRNEYMVDHSQRLIAVYDGTDGGTKRTYDYAIKKQCEIIRLNPSDLKATRISRWENLNEQLF